MTVLDIQHRLRRRLLEIRAMFRFLGNPRFEDSLGKATVAQLAELEVILKSDDAKALRVWARKALNHPLQLKGIRELKELARNKMIPKYSRLTRDQLIRSLEKQHAASVGERRESADGASASPAPSGNT